MTPTQKTIDTPIGPVTLTAEDGVLCGLWYPGHRTTPDRSGFGVEVDRGFEAVERQLAEFFAGDRRTFDVPTRRAGDDFQRRVWERLDAIPFGETTTYGTIARELGDANLARRVGGAVGRNPLSILVPCHRVVGSAGALTGYAGGLERKRALLSLEGVALHPTADRVLAAPPPPAAPTLF